MFQRAQPRVGAAPGGLELPSREGARQLHASHQEDLQRALSAQAAHTTQQGQPQEVVASGRCEW